VSEDPRIRHAIEVLAYWDAGAWADAGGLTIQMAGHLADACRMLLQVASELEVTDEKSAAALGPGEPAPDG